MAQAVGENSAGNDKINAVHWDTSGLTSASCNLVNVTSTREGVVLSFGEAQKRSGGELGVELKRRVVLDVVAAKRLQQLLIKLVADFDARYGKPE